ncbi:hypothetical protein K466DRAFT_404024 [Polyporus arcularius HHB13444]|uniref:Uncharacterized protein n=1 Tax=Polyporus arcularius HHB13444 TaxID=1314778 RepID=A0A5C3PJZ8_9APHY|nr:hypothetical protein K466DRAFT_404024 [Polyporus arcularius HHB13444]
MVFQQERWLQTARPTVSRGGRLGRWPTTTLCHRYRRRIASCSRSGDSDCSPGEVRSPEPHNDIRACVVAQGATECNSATVLCVRSRNTNTGHRAGCASLVGRDARAHATSSCSNRRGSCNVVLCSVSLRLCRWKRTVTQHSLARACRAGGYDV